MRQCHEIFTHFFHYSNPSNPLLLILKYYKYIFYFADLFSWTKISAMSLTPMSLRLLGVIDTAKSSSEVSVTLRNQAQRCQLQCRVKLRGVIDIAKSSSQVSVTLFQSQAQRCQRCQLHCVRAKLRGVSYTAESSSEVGFDLLRLRSTV